MLTFGCLLLKQGQKVRLSGLARIFDNPDVFSNLYPYSDLPISFPNLF